MELQVWLPLPPLGAKYSPRKIFLKEILNISYNEVLEIKKGTLMILSAELFVAQCTARSLRILLTSFSVFPICMSVMCVCKQKAWGRWAELEILLLVNLQKSPVIFWTGIKRPDSRFEVQFCKYCIAIIWMFDEDGVRRESCLAHFYLNMVHLYI